MKKKKIRIILIAVLAGVFLVSMGMVIRQQIQYRKTIADGEEAARIAGLETGAAATEPSPLARPARTEPPGPSPEETPETRPKEVLELAGIDLGALRAYNEDVVGWISIPGTIVSYPLVQGTDNQYYLTRNWKRESISSGSVFLDYKASPALTDFHTIVYGHRMRNDTMFGSIRNYSDPDYWREHPSVYIVLDGAIYRYDIFSAEEAAVSGIVYQRDIVENHLEGEFLQYCLESSVIDTGLTPETGDRFLTLSTCTGNGYYSSRWVIHGVLAEEYDRSTNN